MNDEQNMGMTIEKNDISSMGLIEEENIKQRRNEIKEEKNPPEQIEDEDKIHKSLILKNKKYSRNIFILFGTITMIILLISSCIIGAIILLPIENDEKMGSVLAYITV